MYTNSMLPCDVNSFKICMYTDILNYLNENSFFCGLNLKKDFIGNNMDKA